MIFSKRTYEHPTLTTTKCQPYSLCFLMFSMNNIKILEANNLTLMSDCLNIRKKVFIEEQGVPEEIELDELDKSSFHAICFSFSTSIYHAKLFVELQVKQKTLMVP